MSSTIATLADVWAATPTESEAASRAIVLDLLSFCDAGQWRGYSSTFYGPTVTLVNRFLSSHAQVDTPVGPVRSTTPAQIFAFSDEHNNVKGATWATGAVLVSRPTEAIEGHTEIVTLFLPNTIVKTWGYPDVYQSRDDQGQD